MASMSNRTIEPVYRRIGRRVSQYRDKEGMSQRRLAFLIGQSRVSVYNIERGLQRVPIHVLQRIGKALDAELEDFLDP